MSETPRCDAFGDEPYKGDNARLVLLWIRFAESLERELTQAKAELDLRVKMQPTMEGYDAAVTECGNLTIENTKLKAELVALRAENERLREDVERLDWMEELTKRLATWQGASGMVEQWLETDICIRGPNVNIYIRNERGKHVRGGTGSCVRLAIDSARKQP